MKIVIVGASSGIGHAVARLFIEDGWEVCVAARRVERLEDLRQLAPERVSVAHVDVDADEAASEVVRLLGEGGKADVYFHVSGIGYNNVEMDLDKEVRTAVTNGVGFVRCVAAAYRFFRDNGGGHIAAVSSVASTKGMGPAPAYSATKRLQRNYLQALAQLSRSERAGVTVTEVRPGFIRTDLLADGRKYPLVLDLESSAVSIFRAVKSRRRIATVDWKYRLLVGFWRLIPDFIWERMGGMLKVKS